MDILFLCIQIFLVRIVDVSLGTVRVVMTVKSKSLYAAIVGFFEVLIWFLVVREALNVEEMNFFIPIAYAGGFACGTYIGGILSNKYISGNYGVQVILSDADSKKVDIIREHGFGVSVVNVKGKFLEKPKLMLFIEINKKKYEVLEKLIKGLDSEAFMVVNETKMVHNGFFK